MEHAWNKIKQEVYNSLEAALKKEKLKVTEDELWNSIEEPPSAKMGDLACSISFPLGKKARKSPRDIAEQILAVVKKPKYVKKVALAGAYVNFFLDRNAFAREVIGEAVEKARR